MTKRTLKMTRGVHQYLLDVASRNKSTEFVGLLTGSRLPTGVVDGVSLLPADAGGSHASATGAAIIQAIASLGDTQRTARGLVHSHGGHQAYHSSIDDATIERVLPKMALPVVEGIPAAMMGPHVLGRDVAVLPLAHGRQMRFELLGQPVGNGLGATLRTAWTSIETTVGGPDKPARACFAGESHLVLEAGEVVLTLGLPAGATVTQTVTEPALRSRIAYSVVVNDHGRVFVEALLTCDVAGESLTAKVPCELEIVGEKPLDWTKANRHFLTYEDVTALDAFQRPCFGARVSVWSNPDEELH